MIKFKSRKLGIEVFFEQEETYIQDVFDVRGETITTSLSEHIKSYHTRSVLKPSEIKVKYMTKVEYLKLLEMRDKDNFFDIETDYGDTYSQCLMTGSISSLQKIPNRQNNSYFYSGSLTVEVR